MTKFFRRGRDWFTTDDVPKQLDDVLPVGTYNLNRMPDGEYCLTEVEGFTLPEKTYGSEIGRYDRIIKTFLSRPAGTGVILAGEKGAGKTLLSKKLSIELAAQYGIPTIIINNAYHGDDFNQFLQSIRQPALVILDEFEKVYNKEAQNKLLTVLDGTMQSKKLFVVAINDVSKINSYMVNRPGRFFYVFNYEGVAEDAIREFLEDKLENKSRLESVVAYTGMFRNFTFDMLAAVVEEMNRYDETIQEVLKYINVSAKFGCGDYYEVLSVEFKSPDEDNLGWHAESLELTRSARNFYDGNFYNPLEDEVSQVVYHKTKGEDGEPATDYEYYSITPADIVKMEKGGAIRFETDEIRMRIGKKAPKKTYPMYALSD